MHVKNTKQRSSTKRVAMKDLLKLFVSNYLKNYIFKLKSSDTIDGMKLHIYEKLGVSPIDQFLIYKEQALTENQKSLEEYNVQCENVEEPIFLIIQQRSTNDQNEGNIGFGDTNLQ